MAEEEARSPEQRIIVPAGADVPESRPREGDGKEPRPKPSVPEVLPILPIRALVMFPGTVMELAVGRPASRRLLDESLPDSKIIGLIAQRDAEDDQPTPEDLHTVGTAATVLKLNTQSDDTLTVLVHGLERIAVKEFVQRKPFFKARVERIAEQPGSGKVFEAAVNQLREEARQLIELSPNAPEEAVEILVRIEDPGNLADYLAANLSLEVEQKQDLLEEPDVAKRVRIVHQYVSAQLEILKLQQKIQEDVQTSIGETQRKFFLREQLKAINRELGEDESGTGQVIDELRERIEAASPPEQVMKEAERDLDRLRLIPPASPEHSVIVTYLELIADLPWNKASEDNLDLKRAQEILDQDHFDLDKVKRRLIEYLAVRKLNPEGRGPILCLVGPPGVGKTSLGQSIANALGRQFARLSLGGIRDEAEIRGHRRTYIGAMPGRIIQELRRAGTKNPVMMLDEMDKLGSDFRGDPASAMLEVLDPRQNHAFVDRYLDLPFDLSSVIFIATANYIENVPPPLRDRMEIIDIPGYTDNEKLQIAKRYLVPRQLKENGLKKSQCRWRKSGLRKVIGDYTREAGVRELERQIGAVCRGVAAKVAAADAPNDFTATVTAEFVRETLGPERYVREVETRTKIPGVVVGLAYTPTGGEILFIEAAAYPGKGNVTLTGQMGDVMRESATAAFSLFKSRAGAFNFDLATFAERDLHIHVPAGAVPKDGPSAGTAMYSAIASLLLGLPIQPKLAMTGEITLRGLVLPVGGIKEKSLAASRAGIKTIILPAQNKRDMEEVDPEVREKCQFHFVENVDQVLELAFGKDVLKKAIQDRAPGKLPVT